jgi:hypothetical protein
MTAAWSTADPHPRNRAQPFQMPSSCRSVTYLMIIGAETCRMS